jgi:putative peptidoglycan lipid II flippase
MQVTRVARSSLIVMSGLAVATVSGLIRDRIIAGKFGIGLEMDAFTAANSAPELLFTMISGGALAFAYIPIYSEILSSRSQSEASKLGSRVINTVFLLAAAASGLAAIFAPVLVQASWGVGANFPEEVQLLTIELMRILLLATTIFALSSIVTGTLHAHQHFLLPALTPTLYSASMIVGAIFLSPSMGIFGLAWGSVIGAVVHLTIQLPGLRHVGFSWSPSMGWKNPDFHRVAILMAPRIIDLMMARISIDWINANLGSGLGVGRVSALKYAFRLMNMPWTLIGTAIGIAIFPTLASLAASKSSDDMRQALSGSIRAILTLTLPAAAGLLVLGRPIIQLLFQQGEFGAESTDLVFFALQFYTVALISQSLLEVVVRGFASRQDTVTPLLISFFTTAINIGLALVLSRSFQAGGLEIGGLALANGIAVGIEVLLGMTIIHFKWQGLDVRRIAMDSARAAIAALVMWGVITAFKTLVQPGPVLAVVGGASLGIAIYFVVASLLGIHEIRALPLALLRKASGHDERPM